MSQSDWLQLIALLMMAVLVLPALLRRPWRGSRIFLFIALWLGIFLIVSLAIRFLTS